MRILRLNSISGFRGGVEAYIESVDKLLYGLGHRTLTLTFNSGEPGKEDTDNLEIRVEAGAISRAFSDLIPSSKLISFLLEKHEQFKPDLIHIHHIRIAHSSIEKFLNLIPTPAVFTAHDALLACPLSTLVQPGNKICEGKTGIRCGFTGCEIHGHLVYELMLASTIKRLAKNKIKAFLCPSYSVYNYLHHSGFGPMVHLPSFSMFEEQARNEEPNYGNILTRKYIGYIGRLEWYKGVHDLIDAFSIFLKTHPDFRLRIAGIGFYENELKRKSTELGLEPYIDWLGKIGPEQKEEFYRTVSSVVVPSNYWENFPLVAQESLLRGIPTVGTDIGGIPEIIKDGITGRIVPIASPEKIAEALNDIYRNLDKSLEFMKAGRLFILNNVSPERHLEGLLKVYKKILTEGGVKDMSEALEL